MDFDKIKQTAKNTIKMVSDKVEDKFSTQDINITPTDDFDVDSDYDDFDVNTDDMGQTKKFGLKDAIEQLNKQKDGFSGTLSDIFGKKFSKTDEHNEVDDPVVNAVPVTSDDAPSPKRCDSTADDTSKLTAEFENIHSTIAKLTNDIAEIRSNSAVTESTMDKLAVSVDSIERKLNDISNSLSGVNKLNDSLFDLKNSQMNTKNSLSELEVSFRRLKKKMTASVVVMSIIAVIIAVLEVINLLS